MIRPLLIALAAATLLSACGHRGELERPQPMWGEGAESESEEAQRQREERERRSEQGGSTSAPSERESSPR